MDRKDIHYIGGSDILPAPLEAAAEKKAIKDLGTEKMKMQKENTD